MLKSMSGRPHVPVRARLELGCTRPSQAIMTARLTALEAARATDMCRAGELQHCCRWRCTRYDAAGPCLWRTGTRTL